MKFGKYLLSIYIDKVSVLKCNLMLNKINLGF